MFKKRHPVLGAFFVLSMFVVNLIQCVNVLRKGVSMIEKFDDAGKMRENTHLQKRD